MKFYFSAHYSTASRRVGLFKKLFAPELISLAIICDNGERFFAINTDFSSRYANPDQDAYIASLPSLVNPAWKSMKEIKRDLINFIYENDKAAGPFLFVHDNDEIGCAILYSMLEERDFMDTINVRQTINEYVDGLSDVDFGPASNYRTEIFKTGDVYTFEEKMQMFNSHENYPEKSRVIEHTDEAQWIRSLHVFINAVKKGLYNPEDAEPHPADISSF